jgi:hypothetical protein
VANQRQKHYNQQDGEWPAEVTDFLHNDEFGKKVFKCLNDDYSAVLEEGYAEAYQLVEEYRLELRNLKEEIGVLRKALETIQEVGNDPPQSWLNIEGGKKALPGQLASVAFHALQKTNEMSESSGPGEDMAFWEQVKDQLDKKKENDGNICGVQGVPSEGR